MRYYGTLNFELDACDPEQARAILDESMAHVQGYFQQGGTHTAEDITAAEIPQATYFPFQQLYLQQAYRQMPQMLLQELPE